MKKLVLVLAILMVLPAAAFGIQYDLMNDGSMDEVTGQAGVSIAFDDIQLFLNIERIAWIDCDGFASFEGYGTCDGAPGAVGIQNFQLDVVTINAITTSENATLGGGDGSDDGNPNLGSVTCGELDLVWDYGDTAPLGGCQIDTGYAGVTNNGGTLGLDNLTEVENYYSALTIDATSQLPALTNIQSNNEGEATNMGGVLIGIPTMEVYIPAMSLTPAFYNVQDTAAEAANDVDGDGDEFDTENTNYGTIEMTGITFTTLSGWIEIAPH